MSPFKAIAFTLVHNIITIACLDYPTVRRDESIEDNYNGTKVKDPFRWLENIYTEEVEEYLERQNNFTLNYLSECKQRNEFTMRLDDIKKYPQYTEFFKRGTRYFQKTKHTLFVRDNRESSGRDVFENLQNVYTTNDLMNYNFVSRDGELVAFYVYRNNGWLDLKIFNITSQTLHPDSIRNVGYFQHLNTYIAWDGDSMGFFYTLERIIIEGHRNFGFFGKPRIYYHQLGTEQENDVLVADSSDVNYHRIRVILHNSARGDYLIIQTVTAYDDENHETMMSLKIFNVQNISTDVRKLERMDLKLQPIFNWKHDAVYTLKKMNYVANVGELFYFTMVKDKSELIEINLLNSTEKNWRTVIDEDPIKSLHVVTAVDKDKVLVQFETKDATEGKYLVELRSLKSGSLIRTFPTGIGGRLKFFGSFEDSEVLFISNELPGLPEYTLVNVSDPKSAVKKLFNLTDLSSYDPSQFMKEITSYPGTNGDVLNMTIIHKKDLKLDGTASILIVFEDDVSSASEQKQYELVHAKDFSTVAAYPRDDKAVIAAAEFLVQQGYGNASRIVLQQNSVFGLVSLSLSDAINKRPDLFRALLVLISRRGFPIRLDISVVLCDLFRREFRAPPLHNIPLNQSGQFPGVFIGTQKEYWLGLNRQHLEYKYIAELQATVGKTSRQTNPFLLRAMEFELETSNDIFVRAVET